MPTKYQHCPPRSPPLQTGSLCSLTALQTTTASSALNLQAFQLLSASRLGSDDDDDDDNGRSSKHHLELLSCRGLRYVRYHLTVLTTTSRQKCHRLSFFRWRNRGLESFNTRYKITKLENGELRGSDFPPELWAAEDDIATPASQLWPRERQRCFVFDWKRAVGRRASWSTSPMHWARRH